MSDYPNIDAAEVGYAVGEDTRTELVQLEGVLEGDTGHVIRPGDTLILSSPYPLTVAQADRVKAELMRRLPALGDVVVLGNGITVTGIYRPDPQDDDEPS